MCHAMVIIYNRKEDERWREAVMQLSEQKIISVEEKEQLQKNGHQN